jgi:hypothetical protein
MNRMSFAIVTLLCGMACLPTAANAWAVYPTASYITPYDNQELVLNTDLSSPSSVSGQMNHRSYHRIDIEGLAIIDDGKSGSCDYGFRNEVASTHGTDGFVMGITAHHVVVAGHGRYLNGIESFFMPRPTTLYVEEKTSVARTWGHFTIANGLPTGIPPSQVEDTVEWRVIVPGGVSAGGNGGGAN